MLGRSQLNDRVGVAAVLRALSAELRGVGRVIIRAPATTWFGLAFMLAVPAIVGLLPLGWFSLVLQVLGFLFVSGVLVWPELVAKQYRSDDELGIRERDGRDVVTYLPVALAVLSLPFYLLAQATLFWRLQLQVPGLLPGTGWADAWRLSVDNLLFTELFLDLFDVFGLGLAAEPSGLAGRVVVFITRLLLSVGFVRVALTVLRAAYYQAHGLGSGGDALAELESAVSDGDAVRAGHVGAEIVGQVHGTIDVLLARLRSPDVSGTVRRDAYRCLRVLRDWAMPMLRERHLRGHEHADQYEGLVDDLWAAWSGETPEPPVRRHLRTVTLLVLAVGLMAVLVWGSPMAAFMVGAVTMIALVVLLIAPRATYERAMELGVVPYVALEGLRRATLLSSSVLAAGFLLVSWQTLWHAGFLWPDAFDWSSGEASSRAMLGFVGASLARVQVFLSVPDVFGLAESTVEQRPWIGSLLTLVLRTGLNLGFVAVVFTALSFGRDRQGLAGLLTVPAELGMRLESLRGGRYAFGIVTHYVAEVNERLWGALDASDRADVQEALADSGVMDWCVPYEALDAPATPERLRSHSVLTEAVQFKGWSAERWEGDLNEAVRVGSWPHSIHAQVLARLAVVAARRPGEAGALERLQGSLDLIENQVTDPTEAHAVWITSVLRVALNLPTEVAITSGFVALLERAHAFAAELVDADRERFIVVHVRIGVVRALTLSRASMVPEAVALLEATSSQALDLPAKHPWRDVLLVEALLSSALVAEAASDEDAERRLSVVEERIRAALASSAGRLDPRHVAVRATDPRAFEFLGSLPSMLARLPASQRTLAAATAVAEVLQAQLEAGGTRAVGYEVAAQVLRARFAHELGVHAEAQHAAARVIELCAGAHPTPEFLSLLAYAHAVHARSSRALGDEVGAFHQAAMARSRYDELEASAWDGAESAVAHGRSLLDGFGGGRVGTN